MNEQSWRAERDSRSLRYAGRVLDPNRWILLRADPAYAGRYDGQVAILTVANLLGRMTPSLALDVPSVPIVAPLPWAGTDLREHILGALLAADPYGRFQCRTAQDGDYHVHLGRDGAPVNVHGSGWNVYCGSAPSPLPDDDTANPIGPALAAILAAAGAFENDLSAPPGDVLLNALTWRPAAIGPEAALLLARPNLGTLWTVGTGSVGTAILYFLTLATQEFAAGLFDMDDVKVHNLDRSPVFIAEHVGMKKVAATAQYLERAGVGDVWSEPRALDESPIWRDRPQGVPDALIAAANERNVRTVIENGFPPIQVYGTTGKNWQAAMIRHIPLQDPCSSCLFPETQHAPTACATDTIEREDGQQQVDAALPFLSFAAGAMAAAEILKLRLPGYPYSANRVLLNTRLPARAVQAALPLRQECICGRRSQAVHRKMIEGSRFAGLSLPG